MSLRHLLLIPIFFPLAPAVVHAQDAEAARGDAEWLVDCRDEEHDRDNVRACEILVDSVPTAAGSIVIEASPNGAVEVRGWDGPGIEVHARIQSHARTQEQARAKVRAVRLELSPGRIRAVGEDERSGGVSFEVLVPRSSGLEVATFNGPLAVRGIQSVMKLSTENGPLSLVDVGGDVTARLTNGPLHIELSGDRWQGAGLDAETVNGPVNLEVPEDYSAELEFGTRNGPFSSDFAFTVEAGGEFPDHVRVTLGDGGAPIRVVTTNGPVRLRRP
jgi:hypothetical protein